MVWHRATWLGFLNQSPPARRRRSCLLFSLEAEGQGWWGIYCQGPKPQEYLAEELRIETSLSVFKSSLELIYKFLAKAVHASEKSVRDRDRPRPSWVDASRSDRCGIHRYGGRCRRHGSPAVPCTAGTPSGSPTPWASCDSTLLDWIIFMGGGGEKLQKLETRWKWVQLHPEEKCEKLQNYKNLKTKSHATG